MYTMQKKFVLFFFTVWNFVFYSYSTAHSNDLNDHYLHGLASLFFHTQMAEKHFNSPEFFEEEIMISREETSFLWNKVSHALASLDSLYNFNSWRSLFEKAYTNYQQANQLIDLGNLEGAQKCLNSSVHVLRKLWLEAIEYEEKTTSKFSISLCSRNQIDLHFENNPYISTKARNAMRPYLLSLKHPMYSILDHIFLKTRATKDKHTFYKAGFKTIAKGSRSFIHVAKHQKLPGYLIKAYFDTELRKKSNRSSWMWLAYRCEGASKIRDIIDKRKIRYFVVPKKWIYCLPPEPSPPKDEQHTRHLAVLLVSNMNLTSREQNLYAWSHEITKSHLDELFEIISRAKGSSYRPDNIAYTKEGTFAFVDTEYPYREPDFKSIRKFLSSEMLKYWDELIKQGGPD